MLDYDGTLVGFNMNPEKCAPDESLKKLLTKLGADTQNTVVVISGRKRETLEEWLEGLPVSIVAEHGVWERNEAHEWTKNVSENANSWMEQGMEIMNFYVDRTPGSFIEEKSHSLVWHYRKVEKGLGEIRKSELTSHLKHMLNDRGLQVLDGHFVVEVKPSVINKGLVAARWYDEFNPDFCFCIGDDVTDEDMFATLPKESYTIKVGSGQSQARFSTESVESVREVLSGFLR